MVWPDDGSEITLVCGVSRRILPSLERHMRDADCEGGPPAAGCVLVAQSEHEGAVGGGCGIWTTAGLSLARPSAAVECQGRARVLSVHGVLPVGGIDSSLTSHLTCHVEACARVFLMIGRLIGHYRIVEKIGAGGMGEIFRAHDERLGRDVALKLIRPASSDNPDHLRRFELEARAAASLNHPNIVAIYDVGFNEGSPYIVSELLHGKTLRLRISEGLIPVREAADYALQVAHGLVAAHE